jgi:hypothetical protein
MEDATLKECPLGLCDGSGIIPAATGYGSVPMECKCKGGKHGG